MHVPYGIDIDIDGNVLLADRANDRIQEFDYQGKFIMTFGSKGSGPVNLIIRDTSSLIKN